jgi:hypothetical protein
MKPRKPATTRLARWIGVALIASAWLVLVYLIVHYAVLLYFGPDRLYALLGGKAYNALFPMGGFVLLASLYVLFVIWGAPVALFAGIAAGALYLVAPRQRVRWRLGTAAVAGVIMTGALPVVLLDGWPDTLFGFVLYEDTQYSRTYTTSGFRRVRVGMTPEHVLAVAGEPLERRPIHERPGEVYWNWTRSPGSHSYRVRSVRFRNGTVVEKHSSFYVD